MTKKFLYLFIVATTFTACYQDVEGCLDVNASNLDLDADFTCLNDDCCTYPTLGVEVTHLYEGEALRTDSFYRDAANNQFRLNRLRYYWSELVLNEESGNAITPIDSVEFGLLESSADTVFQLLNDNLVLISTATADRQEFGTFRGAEGSVSITGRLGIDEPYRRVIPVTAPANHPLSTQEGKMRYGIDTGYLQLKLEYAIIQGVDTLNRVINVTGSQGLGLLFPGIITIPRGINVTVFIDAETAILLNGIDLMANDEEITAQLVANAPVMWTVTALLGN